METRECIKTRRSVRRFTAKPVSDEMIHELLEAIRWAPSWGNSQCCEVVLVRDPQLKEALTGCLDDRNPATLGFLQAPLLFVICGKMGRSGYKKGITTTMYGDWFMFDSGIAAQNLCLAAHDLGLGTVHCGNFDHQRVNEMLGLPKELRSLEMIPVGWPENVGNAPPRRELTEFVHWEKYGNHY